MVAFFNNKAKPKKNLNKKRQAKSLSCIWLGISKQSKRSSTET